MYLDLSRLPMQYSATKRVDHGYAVMHVWTVAALGRAWYFGDLSSDERPSPDLVKRARRAFRRVHAAA